MPDEGVLRVVVVRKGKVKPTEFRLRDGEVGLSLFRSADQNMPPEWTAMVRDLFRQFAGDSLDEASAIASYERHNDHVRATAPPDRLRHRLGYRARRVGAVASLGMAGLMTLRRDGHGSANALRNRRLTRTPPGCSPHLRVSRFEGVQ